MKVSRENESFLLQYILYYRIHVCRLPSCVNVLFGPSCIVHAHFGPYSMHFSVMTVRPFVIEYCNE